ncbi:MAG: Hpt domain-containing protein [Leptolyngbyaceae cyanobacterium bins.59]|nr:Hpt domain-containing protein [Leptolyngbyaceae cyanobacterium bins.59]
MNTFIDWNYLHQVAQGDEAFALELLALFVEDNQPYVDRAKQAVNEQDFARVAQTAHKIKGSSANIGAATIQSLAEDLEQQALNEQSEEIMSLLSQLEDFMRSIQSFLGVEGIPVSSSD